MIPPDPNSLFVPANWYRTSRHLLAAARTLWHKVDAGFPRPNQTLTRQAFKQAVSHAPPFLLLCAFAVENALKGTRVRQIVARGDLPTFVNRPTIRENNVWGHNLPELAKESGLQTDPRDDEFLHVLMRNIEWAGRYPAPGEKGKAFIQRWGSSDMDYVVRLIRRIRRL